MSVTHTLEQLGAHFISLTKRGVIYGPQGKLLLKNLEDYWFLHCVTMPCHNIFLSDELTTSLNLITKNEMNGMPFGLAVIKDSKNSWNQNLSDVKKSSHKTAETTIFSNDTEAKDLFHKIQRERKTWWRKLAQWPSRFKFTEAKKLRNLNSVDIEAEFPFGNITVERITYHTNVEKLFSKVDNQKDFSYIQMVEHIVSLDWGCLALLCDAHESNKTTKVHIHPKLAPHKVAFCIKRPNDEVDSNNDNLNRFVLYLNSMLRTKGLSTILTISEQIADICLVPFIVSVDATSLDNGIIYIRDRSTTLDEAIHVTDLVKYIITHC